MTTKGVVTTFVLSWVNLNKWTIYMTGILTGHYLVVLFGLSNCAISLTVEFFILFFFIIIIIYSRLLSIVVNAPLLSMNKWFNICLWFWYWTNCMLKILCIHDNSIFNGTIKSEWCYHFTGKRLYVIHVA